MTKKCSRCNSKNLSKHCAESKRKNDLVETVEEIYKRINLIHELMLALRKISWFEHRSEILLLELEKSIESTFLDIILLLKMYMGIKIDQERKHFKKFSEKIFHERLEADEENYKLMICNLALLADSYEKEGGHHMVKKIINLIQHKYGDELKPVYKKYGDRVLTDYGISVH